MLLEGAVLKPGLFFLCLVAFFFLTGCSPKVVESPKLLADASNCLYQNQQLALWKNDLHGLNAAMIFGSAGKKLDNTSFYASFRSKSLDDFRFILLLPQGTKLGQCEVSSGITICKAAKLPRADEFLQNGLDAIRSILALKMEKEADCWLQYGDKIANIASEELVLVTQKKHEEGVISLLSDTKGKVFAGYYIKNNKLIWKINFHDVDDSLKPNSFTFEKSQSPWIVNVQILDVL